VHVHRVAAPLHQLQLLHLALSLVRPTNCCFPMHYHECGWLVLSQQAGPPESVRTPSRSQYGPGWGGTPGPPVGGTAAAAAAAAAAGNP